MDNGEKGLIRWGHERIAPGVTKYTAFDPFNGATFYDLVGGWLDMQTGKTLENFAVGLYEGHNRGYDKATASYRTETKPSSTTSQSLEQSKELVNELRNNTAATNNLNSTIQKVPTNTSSNSSGGTSISTFQ